MQHSRYRRIAADDNQIPPTSLLANPDRVALWAVVLAVVAMIAGVASAQGNSSGGIGGSGTLGWQTQRATWYGPGFFGNETACGKTLTRATVGVAHRTLPCGSKVVLRYEGRFVRTMVIDRGPFAHRAKWDLTQAAAKRIGLETTDLIGVRVEG